MYCRRHRDDSSARRSRRVNRSEENLMYAITRPTIRSRPLREHASTRRWIVLAACLVGGGPGSDVRAGASVHVLDDGPWLVGLGDDRRHWHQCQRADHRGVLSGNRSPDEVRYPKHKPPCLTPRPCVPVEQRDDDRPRHARRTRLPGQRDQRLGRGLNTFPDAITISA